MAAYPGPVPDAALPVAFHNTIYAVRGERVDGLSDAVGLRAWIDAVRELPVKGAAIDGARLGDFHALRSAVRDVLHAVVDGRALPTAAVAEVNRRSAGAPRHEWLGLDHGAQLAATIRYGDATPTDIALGHLARATIELVAGPQAAQLQLCGAPGCVLMFVKDHPRREWCSTSCGNRARQARHYARRRRATA